MHSTSLQLQRPRHRKPRRTQDYPQESRACRALFASSRLGSWGRVRVLPGGHPAPRVAMDPGPCAASERHRPARMRVHRGAQTSTPALRGPLSRRVQPQAQRSDSRPRQHNERSSTPTFPVCCARGSRPLPCRRDSAACAGLVHSRGAGVENLARARAGTHVSHPAVPRRPEPTTNSESPARRGARPWLTTPGRPRRLSCMQRSA